MLPTLLFLLLLPVAPSTIVRNIGCGETVKINSSVVDWNLHMPINMFYGAKVIVKGINLDKGTFRFFSSVNSSNQFFWLYNVQGKTQLGVAPGTKWTVIDTVNPPITPLTGPYTLEFTILMTNTVRITNGTHLLYNFPLQTNKMPDNVAGTIGLTGSFSATSVKYICNCRAPNANRNAIEKCLGLK